MPVNLIQEKPYSVTETEKYEYFQFGTYFISFSVRNPFVFKLHWKEGKLEPLTEEDKKDEFPDDYGQAFPCLLNRYILHLYNKI